MEVKTMDDFQSNQSNKSQDTLNKINCEVKNCVHHCNDNSCSASTVKVVPYDACKCYQTECGTFEEKPEQF